MLRITFALASANDVPDTAIIPVNINPAVNALFMRCISPFTILHLTRATELLFLFHVVVAAAVYAALCQIPGDAALVAGLCEAAAEAEDDVGHDVVVLSIPAGGDVAEEEAEGDVAHDVEAP